MRRVQILGLEKAKPSDTAFAVFDNLSELKRYASAISKRSGGPEVLDYREEFLGGISAKAALEQVALPHDELAAKTSKVMESLRDLVAEATERVRHFHYFGRPSVPRALANLPKASVRYREENTITAPLTVVVDTTSLETITRKELETIGVYICAAVAILSISRPVALYSMTVSKYLTVDCKEAQGFAVRLPSSPVDLPRVAWMLSSDKFCRGISYTVAANICDSPDARHVGHILWPASDSRYFTRPGYLDWLNTTFGSEVLYFGPRVSWNVGCTNMIKDPDKWVRDTVERYSTE
jgi:hypothetical protein